MPLEDARDLVIEMRRYYRARAPWHDSYMGYTGNPAMEALLRPVVGRVGDLLTGLDVLEIACGTGNWTQVLARRARSILATDINEETLMVAREKEYTPGEVMFQPADAYALDHLAGGFTGAFAADWWSHVPRLLLGAFLAGLHGHLAAGARVVFVDMLPRAHPDLQPYRHDSDGDAICRRTLPDGSTFDVVKNFPRREDVLAAVADVGEGAEYEEWGELGRWMVTYATPAPAPS